MTKTATTRGHETSEQTGEAPPKKAKDATNVRPRKPTEAEMREWFPPMSERFTSAAIKRS